MDVICTDCITYMSSCPEETFDLIIADPPYFQIYGEFDFQWKNVEEYIDWCKTWVAGCCRVLKKTGSFYLWGKIGFGNGFPLFKVVDWIEKEKMFRVVNWITQRNSRGRGTKKGYMEAREELVFMVRSDDYTWNPAYTEEKSKRKDLGFDGKPRKNEYKRCSDVWIDIAEASQSSLERFDFPTTKALKLCERIIKSSSNPNDLIFIPFGGSGSEAVACEKLQRRYVLTEISQQYIDEIILPRLKTQQAM